VPWVLRSSAPLLLFGVVCLAQAAEDVPPQTARQLVDAALAARKQADGLEKGWERAYDTGIALAEKAIEADPNLADAYYAVFVNLGRKSERTGMTAQMANIGRLKELLRKTLELDPRHSHAWEATGEMLIRLPWVMGGSEKKGEEALRRAKELSPKWAKPALRLAELHWKKGNAEDARAEALEARELARAASDGELLEDAEALVAEIGRQSPPR